MSRNGWDDIDLGGAVAVASLLLVVIFVTLWLFTPPKVVPRLTAEQEWVQVRKTRCATMHGSGVYDPQTKDYECNRTVIFMRTPKTLFTDHYAGP